MASTKRLSSTPWPGTNGHVDPVVAQILCDICANTPSKVNRDDLPSEWRKVVEELEHAKPNE